MLSDLIFSGIMSLVFEFTSGMFIFWLYFSDYYSNISYNLKDSEDIYMLLSMINDFSKALFVICTIPFWSSLRCLNKSLFKSIIIIYSIIQGLFCFSLYAFIVIIPFITFENLNFKFMDNPIPRLILIFFFTIYVLLKNGMHAMYIQALYSKECKIYYSFHYLPTNYTKIDRNPDNSPN